MMTQSEWRERQARLSELARAHTKAERRLEELLRELRLSVPEERDLIRADIREAQQEERRMRAEWAAAYDDGRAA